MGTIVGFSVVLLAVAKRDRDLKRAGFAVLFAIALVSLPTYMTGYSAQKAVRAIPDIPLATITLHQRSALLALIFMEATGVIAWYALWRRPAQPTRGSLNTAALVVCGAVTIALMSNTAMIGGEIHHPEILSAGAAPATEGVLAPRWLGSDFITQYQNSHPWAWKTLETIHFMGLCLLFGVVVVGNTRLLGGMRAAPLEGFHRLLPWGVWGFVANSVTGMLFFIGQAFQYIDNPAFHLKMLCVLAAGGDVLYMTWNEQLWTLAAGETPPRMVKVLAASQIALWVGVIYFGRMLPYLGDAF